MSTKHLNTALRTGSRMAFEHVEAMQARRDEYAQQSDATIAGYALDAPELMPAGSVSCLCYADWRGRALTAQTEARRA